MFLYELDLKGELTSENLKLNINKIKEKLLNEEGFQKIIDRINGITLLTRSFIPELIKMMCQCKMEAYSEQMFAMKKTEFDLLVLTEFDHLNRPLMEQEFKDVFSKSKKIKIP